MDKNVIVSILLVIVTLLFFSGCFSEDTNLNITPIVEILYPIDGITVSNIVIISGTASDPDNNVIEKVEIMINDGEWRIVEGTKKWSYDWRTYELNDGSYIIKARCWDGNDFSIFDEISVIVDNPDSTESDDHKWALFIAAANFPSDNESKLGNGGLNLAEEIATYLIKNCGYSTSNIIILFDDGWIRSDNGYGTRLETLQERKHEYNFSYGGATTRNVETILEFIVEESNKYIDSEIFIWFFGHGCGNENDPLTGGKILESSSVFLWDGTLTDNELGDHLSNLKSKKTCIIIDACFSGGFSDRTIYNFPTLFITRSGIPESGRIVIASSSKFRLAYASTTRGPLFSILWLEGLTTKNADGFRPGILKSGRPTRLNFFKDGKASVEESFYYARYMLKTIEDFNEFKDMEPQINDKYPNSGLLRSYKEMFLG